MTVFYFSRSNFWHGAFFFFTLSCISMIFLSWQEIQIIYSCTHFTLLILFYIIVYFIWSKLKMDYFSTGILIEIKSALSKQNSCNYYKFRLVTYSV